MKFEITLIQNGVKKKLVIEARSIAEAIKVIRAVYTPETRVTIVAN